jgi:RNA polymerase sigma-70 factor (ECF subfamily)
MENRMEWKGVDSELQYADVGELTLNPRQTADEERISLPPAIHGAGIELRRTRELGIAASCPGSVWVEVDDRRGEFDRIAMPHLRAAYNLARWLMRHEQDAEDAVQQAFLRAFQSFRGAETGRAWLLKIVRNTCYTRLTERRDRGVTAPLEMIDRSLSVDPSPDSPLEQREERELLLRALDAVSMEFREVLVLRELEGLSYKEIARVAEIPVGTVMSRLARGREQLAEILEAREPKEDHP